MFTEIKSQFIDGLEEQLWMDNKTRAQARLKVSNTSLMLGVGAKPKKSLALRKLWIEWNINYERDFWPWHFHWLAG